VPQDFPLNPNSLCFEKEEMRRLFEVGGRLGYEGTAWRQTPPEVERGEQELPRTGVRFVTEPSRMPACPNVAAQP
jgi:hypothetical protein